MRRALSIGIVTLLAGAALPAMAAQTPIKINLINTGGVEIGSDAYFGFKTAAKFWETHLTAAQPTTITFDVGFRPLGENILGSTGSSYTSKAIVNVANRIKAGQSGAFDASLNLPTLRNGYFGANDAVDVYTPGYTGCCDVNGDRYGIDNASKVYDTDNSYNNSVIGLTTANAKAIGYAFGDNVDASISFSSDFAFDFNPKDGITANTSDFIAVATHEMGHALGFVSGVDDYDVLGTGGPAAGEACFADGTLCQDYRANDDWFGETLDLFRYSAPGVLDWTTNTASYFSIDGGVTAYQGGLFSTGSYNGDSWQASHWKAPEVTLPDGSTVFSCAQPKLGIMNPYICDGRNGIVTGLDMAALDAIGWNTTVDVGSFAQSTADFSSFVPEPAAWTMMITGFGLVGGMARRRRAGVVAA